MSTTSDELEPRYRTCACQHCDGRIEFDATEFGPDEIRIVECPHCHSQTEIFVELPPAPPPIPTAPPVQEPPWFGSEASSLQIRTSSGALVEIKEVQLYDEQELKEISVEKARATELLGGSQSPFGFIGGAFWVISNMIAQNYVAQKQSDKMAQEGFAIIERLAKREQKLRSAQTFFHVGRIENIDYPSPSLWRVAMPGRTFGYIHSGDDFVTAKDASGKVYSLRWSAIEQYIFEANT